MAEKEKSARQEDGSLRETAAAATVAVARFWFLMFPTPIIIHPAWAEPPLLWPIHAHFPKKLCYEFLYQAKPM